MILVNNSLFYSSSHKTVLLHLVIASPIFYVYLDWTRISSQNKKCFYADLSRLTDKEYYTNLSRVQTSPSMFSLTDK